MGRGSPDRWLAARVRGGVDDGGRASRCVLASRDRASRAAVGHPPRRAAQGKRHRGEVARFLMDAESECLRLQARLRVPLSHPASWQPGAARQFTIADPKRRTITALPFVDRVVHHVLCAQLEPVLERYAIHDSYACRVGRGQLAALHRAQEFARAERQGCFWKGDVSAYFASIPHDRLLALLARRTRQSMLLGLIERIVRQYPVSVGRGLPIGALTSQHLANLYLGSLDHQVKDTLGVRRYLRYMDDFVAFGERASLLTLRQQVTTYLAEALDLRLNEAASALRPVRDGVPFLGMRVYPSLIRPSRARVRRFVQGQRQIESALLCGQMDEAEAGERLGSQYAQLAQVSSYRLRRRLVASLPSLGQGASWEAGAALTRLEPGEPGRVVGQRRAERAGGEPQQRRPRQPQRQRGVSFVELSTGSDTLNVVEAGDAASKDKARCSRSKDRGPAPRY